MEIRGGKEERKVPTSTSVILNEVLLKKIQIDFNIIYPCSLGRSELRDIQLPLPLKSTGPKSPKEAIPLISFKRKRSQELTSVK